MHAGAQAETEGHSGLIQRDVGTAGFEEFIAVNQVGKRFFNEVRTARQVTHPNVCRVYDIGEVNGQHFLSMEFIDGVPVDFTDAGSVAGSGCGR